MLWIALRSIVSVPLRGSGDESFLSSIKPVTILPVFQSPCGEVVMKALV